jgi:hypothetical protein
MNTETLTHAHQTTITEDAAIKRINRKLAHEGEKLCTARGERASFDLGRHYIINVHTRFLVESHVDVADHAKELGVLAPWEVVAEKGGA